MESKRNETFGNVIFSTNKTRETWTLRQERKEEATRVEGAPPYQKYIHIPPNDQKRSQNPNSTAVTFCIHEIPSWGLLRSSAGGGIDHGGLLHHHHSPSDEV